MFKAEDRFNELGMLVKIISHEMRNPINNLKQAIKTKQQMGDVFYRSTETIDLLFDSVVHAYSELQMMIDFINQVTKGQDIDIQEVQFSTVVNFLMMSDIESTKLHLIGDSRVSVKSNKYGLSLILINLLRNAFEVSMSPVQLVILPSDDSVQIEVIDEGPGLTKDQIHNLWTDASTKFDDHRVRGLGTQIVSFLCEKLGIEIRVDSEWKNGARFILSVPA